MGAPVTTPSLSQPALVNIALDDPKAERVRRADAAAITALRNLPASGLLIIPNVSLPNGTNVMVPHGLGQVPMFVGISAVRGAPSSAGLVQDISSTLSIDRTKYIALQAQHYGAPVIVDLAVL